MTISNQSPSNNGKSSQAKPGNPEGKSPGLIRIVLADDHTVLRDGLAHLLNTEEDFEVVGVAGDGFEAVKMINELRPDVVLMDLQMPRLSGVEAIRRLQEMHVPSNVIILTTFDTDEYIFDGIQAGAKGYLLKDVGREDLCRTIRLVSQGQTLTQPAIAARLFKLLAQDNPRKSEITLTDRELDVLKLLVRGDRNKEIANKLSISESTVKSYVTTIMQKFNVTDRTEAAMYAVQKRIIKLED
jgi:DNA-binding NarL/FixJ family response regulator